MIIGIVLEIVVYILCAVLCVLFLFDTFLANNFLVLHLKTWRREHNQKKYHLLSLREGSLVHLRSTSFHRCFTIRILFCGSWEAAKNNKWEITSHAVLGDNKLTKILHINIKPVALWKMPFSQMLKGKP